MTPSAEDRRKIEFNWYLLAALIIALITAWPLISGGGLLNTRGGGDSPFLIQRLHQLEQAVSDGHFPVRWMPDAAYGYGYPFFNFYAPLAFYVALAYRFVGFSYVQAIHLSQLTAFIAAAWGSFGLARRWYRRDWVALVVSAAYTTAPFHLVNVYVRGDSIAEFWAMGFYPLVILAADQLLTTDRNRGRTGINWINGIAWLALAYGGLVLSHNISAMIFSPFVLLFAVCRLGQKTRRRNGRPAATIAHILPDLALFAVALILGVAVSAWFWLPALSEQQLTSISDMTQGYFNYRFNDGVHFRSTDLVQSSLLFDPSLENLQAFRMGLVQAAVTGIALLTLLWQPVRKRLGFGIWLFMLMGLLISTFMLNPLSLFLWDTLPLLPFTQFPWRFLSVQAFFTAMLAGVPIFGFVRLFGRSPNATQEIRKRPVWLAPLITGFISLGLVIVAVGKLDLNYLPIPDRDVTAESIARYEWFTGNIGTTVSAEYLPPAAWPRPVTSPWLETGERNRVNIVEGSAEVQNLMRKTGRQRWQIHVSSDQSRIIFPTLFWEGWVPFINGERQAFEAAPSSGLMALTVPNGEHEINFVLERSPVRRRAEIISLSALVLIFAIFATDTRRWQLNYALLMIVAVPLLAIVPIVAASLTAPANPNREDVPYTQDFAQLGWLHPAVTVPFGNGQSLNGYRYSQDEVRAGDSVEIILHGDLSGELALVDPADNFVNSAFPIAQAPVSGERIVLEIPADAPAGLFSPRLTLSDGALAQTQSVEDRGELYLRPIRVLPAATADHSNQAGLDVSVVAIDQPLPDKLRMHLVWTTDQPIAENLVASFRLTNQDGMEIHAAQQDFQPGFGHRPTSSWQAGEPVYDVMGMTLPRPLPFESPWTLLVVLYEADSGKTRLFRRLGTLHGSNEQLTYQPVQANLALPADLYPVDQTFSLAGEGVLTLRGFTTEQVEGGMSMSLYWQALVHPPADYSHFVHLIPENGTEAAAQHDAMLGNNTWPTSQLEPGQIIEDRLFLATAGLEAGRYTLFTGLYDTAQENFPRLDVSSGAHGVLQLQTIELSGE